MVKAYQNGSNYTLPLPFGTHQNHLCKPSGWTSRKYLCQEFQFLSKHHPTTTQTFKFTMYPITVSIRRCGNVLISWSTEIAANLSQQTFRYQFVNSYLSNLKWIFLHNSSSFFWRQQQLEQLPLVDEITNNVSNIQWN